MSKNDDTGKLVVYGHTNTGDFCVIKKDVAEKLARLNKAVYYADKEGITWGEFEKRYPDEYKDIFDGSFDYDFDEWVIEEEIECSIDDAKNMYEEENKDNPSAKPLPTRKFEIKGQWIEFFEFLQWEYKTYAAELLSDEAIEKYSYYDSWVGWHVLEKKYKNEIISDLEKQGYICIENEELVEEAGGIFQREELDI